MAQYLDRRANVNSLFGYYTIEQDQTNVTWDAINNTNAMAYDYVLRDKKGKESLQATIKRSDKVVTALTNPIAFITLKRADLKTIAEHLATKYPIVLQRELNKNKTISEARKEAVSVIDKKFDKKMKKHNEEYPKELLGKLVRKLVG